MFGGKIVVFIIEHQAVDRIIDYLKLHVFTEIALMTAEESG
jgi:hypothetical protein